MIRIIKEEPISFASRLDDLMNEKYEYSNEWLGMILGVDPSTISSWRNGHSLPKRRTRKYTPDEMWKKMASIFDVDIEYLKCTQIERKKKESKRKRAIKKGPSEISRKWNAKVTQEELVEIRLAMEKEMQLSKAIAGLEGIGIKIDPEITDAHPLDHEYQIIEDGRILTIVQTDDEPETEPGQWKVYLSDGSQVIRSSDEIIDIYRSMKEYVINQFR